MENYSKPSVANFGRSLFGGYCPTYVPDFVLHGIPSDDKLRQSLMAELTHAVQVKDTAAHLKSFTNAIFSSSSLFTCLLLLLSFFFF